MGTQQILLIVLSVIIVEGDFGFDLWDGKD